MTYSYVKEPLIDEHNIMYVNGLLLLFRLVFYS